MRGFDDLVAAVMAHTRLVVVAMVVLTAVVGAGAPMVDQESSLDQFQSESTEREKLDYAEANFATGPENVTRAQIIVRGDNVLSKDSLVALLEYEQLLRANATINRTLTDERPVFSVANAVATAAIVREEGLELRRLAETLETRRSALEADRTALENRSQEVNRTALLLREALTKLQQDPGADVRTQWDLVRADTDVELNETDYAFFETAAAKLRNATTQMEVQAAYRLGTVKVLEDDYTELKRRGEELEARAEDLQELGERVEQQRAAFRNATDPSLDRQLETLRAMNESEVDATVSRVLNATGSSPVLRLMPTDYEPGSTEAAATVIIVRHSESVSGPAAGATSEQVVDAQLAIQALDPSDGLEYAVFGAGVISHEIDASMSDSLQIVAPLALLFVLLVLTIAYRDLLDILLGLAGIATVLVWTFGLMGWTDISFNQIFVAVPVLLIGLSIDYAIHIFMRHREERETLEASADGAARSEESADGDDGPPLRQGGDEPVDAGPRNSMRVALGGVGIALVYVTATTVIGFVSNLISPVPPIREFGLVSAFGIFAALLVFGLLVPALKVELDELLERVGLDRRKRAFGTGGGRLSDVLTLGATAARTLPVVVIVLALLLSVAGAYGGSQVDTTFEQSDFLASDPPAYMDQLPGSMAPGEYHAKKNLDYVNEHFIREGSEAQILVEGDVTDPAALQAVADAEQRAETRPVTQNLSNGEPAITSPLTVMRTVAEDNESFARTFAAADTDGDGVPDRNVTGVYDALYRAAPDRAASVVHREDGSYRALRLVVSVEGGASGDAVTAQMRDVAGEIDGVGGLTATATGDVILRKIITDQLLETVVQSLLVTLGAVVVFLMGAYRLTEGSATLGLVTMLPVVLSVAWILGTMYLLGIPFNVLTGMITSLTVGLGVAYSIHLSERYNQELDRNGSVWAAMERATTGTGGALLGSAATTVGGFGVLVFAILPPLQQFGLITGLTIVYALLASVLVLPSLLVVWTRFAGPERARDQLRRHGIVTPSAGGDSGDADPSAEEPPEED